LQKGKRIAIPLNTNVKPSGTLRLILHDGIVEVHYTIEVEETENCGNTTIGIDKRYTEVFVDSEGEHYGEGLGKIITVHSDYLKEKHQARNKLRAIANKKPHKKKNIIKNNLGRKNSIVKSKKFVLK